MAQMDSKPILNFPRNFRFASENSPIPEIITNQIDGIDFTYVWLDQLPTDINLCSFFPNLALSGCVPQISVRTCDAYAEMGEYQGIVLTLYCHTDLKSQFTPHSRNGKVHLAALGHTHSEVQISLPTKKILNMDGSETMSTRTVKLFKSRQFVWADFFPEEEIDYAAEPSPTDITLDSPVVEIVYSGRDNIMIKNLCSLKET